MADSNSKALNHSEDVRSTHPHLSQIISATRGIVFLGTPHRGSGTTSLASLVSSVAQVALQDINTRLIWDLESNSQILDRIRDSFGRLLDKRTFTVWSLVEELPMSDGGKVHIPCKSQIGVI
jgi:protein SERAC1